MRVLWLMTGFLAVGTGTLGIFLPLLPTVPLMILAAFCFGKSSPRLHNWLVNHPVYGEHIRDWHAKGAIHRNAKKLATVSIAVAFGLSVLMGVRAQILMIQALVLCAVLIFIWTRPTA
ncbi:MULTISPECIES: YbaN family protein [unclassified Meridianimarinicoccus]|uniref:YbaN family protein n=1 Tax=unclassified Meridianimarinicoccus TaxID=2923344 RepID=UPI0018678455|nr:YbaN family protein [Fluviibacterium sp. MJW13]